MRLKLRKLLCLSNEEGEKEPLGNRMLLSGIHQEEGSVCKREGNVFFQIYLFIHLFFSGEAWKSLLDGAQSLAWVPQKPGMQVVWESLLRNSDGVRCCLPETVTFSFLRSIGKSRSWFPDLTWLGDTLWFEAGLTIGLQMQMSQTVICLMFTIVIVKGKHSGSQCWPGVVQYSSDVTLFRPCHSYGQRCLKEAEGSTTQNGCFETGKWPPSSQDWKCNFQWRSFYYSLKMPGWLHRGFCRWGKICLSWMPFLPLQ